MTRQRALFRTCTQACNQKNVRRGLTFINNVVQVGNLFLHACHAKLVRLIFRLEGDRVRILRLSVKLVSGRPRVEPYIETSIAQKNQELVLRVGGYERVTFHVSVFEIAWHPHG